MSAGFGLQRNHFLATSSGFSADCFSSRLIDFATPAGLAYSEFRASPVLADRARRRLTRVGFDARERLTNLYANKNRHVWVRSGVGVHCK
jgi:hypothetical protein